MYKPGPGQYSPSLSHSTSSPTIKIGQEMGRGDKKADKEQSFKPGAGTYMTNMLHKRRVSGGGWPTTKRPVVGYTKNATPGPSNYSLPAKFGDQPLHELKTQA